MEEDVRKENTENGQAAGASDEKTANPYIDALDNDESDLRDIRLAQERVISLKDKRILGLLAGADNSTNDVFILHNRSSFL